MKAPIKALAGDAAISPTEISLNRKGGSLTATLKKALTSNLTAFTLKDKVIGTAIPLADGDGLILLSSLVDEEDPDVRMVKVAPNRFEILIGEQDEVELDAVSTALLQLKELELTSGRAQISEPVTAQDIRARLIP